MKATGDGIKLWIDRGGILKHFVRPCARPHVFGLRIRTAKSPSNVIGRKHLPSVTKIPQGNCKLGFEGKAQDPPTAPALARLAQDEESGLCGGDARSGGRLGGITRRKREIVGLRNERVRSVFLEIDAFHRERHIPIRRGRSRYEVKQVYI